MHNKEEEEERAALIKLVSSPLQHNWTLYYFKDDKSKKWEDRMQKVDTFHTLCDFFSVLSHACLPSQLPANCDYYIFKEGIAPMWEDKANINGGRWLINVEVRHETLDSHWFSLLKAMVSEQFGLDEIGDQVCGAVVNIRPKGDKIALWTRNASDDRAVQKMGRVIMDTLNPPVKHIRYEVNMELKMKQSSQIKPKHVLYYGDN